MAAGAGSLGGCRAQCLVVGVAVVPVRGHEGDALRGQSRGGSVGDGVLQRGVQFRRVIGEPAVGQGEEPPVRVRQQMRERAAEFLEPHGGELFRRRGG